MIKASLYPPHTEGWRTIQGLTQENGHCESSESFDVIMETKQAAALQLMRSWIMETHSNDLAAATRFLGRLLESKYQSSRSVRSKWCTAKVQQCPSAKFSLGRHWQSVIHEEAKSRASMLLPGGVLGAFAVSEPILSAGIEYLSHWALATRTLDHGDKFSLHVCSFLEDCLAPLFQASL